MISNTSVINRKDSLVYITFPRLTEAGLVKHAFTTRMGGVSEGIFSSMNMSFSRGDKKENVLENYKIIFSALGLNPERAVLSHQTHTDNIRIVTDKDIGKGIVKQRDYSDVDGLITNIKGVTLVTQFADCVPLMFYDPVKKTVAASHAGWRGTVAEIGKKTVEKMVDAFGCNVKDIRAAIGPSIGVCCYEVDAPVVEKVMAVDYLNTEKILYPKPNGKYQLDLRETNRQILINAGIDASNICVSDLCTCCHSEYFHSHRATAGNRGNMAGLIALK